MAVVGVAAFLVAEPYAVSQAQTPDAATAPALGPNGADGNSSLPPGAELPPALGGPSAGGIPSAPGAPLAQPPAGGSGVAGGLGAASVPATVMRAYVGAADSTAVSDPGCHLQWQLLAAIGEVESGQAERGDVDPDGTALRPILGPVLNGSDGFATIPDTDRGRFDHDTRWDRAVGPMQFIPATWAVWGVDGNGDGRADPENVFDAALAAAHYLCADNRDLATPAGLDAAVLSYNDSGSYLATVTGWYRYYLTGTAAVVPDLPRNPSPAPPPPNAANPAGTLPAAPRTTAPAPPPPTVPASPRPTASASGTAPGTPTTTPTGTASPTGSPTASPTGTTTPTPTPTPTPTQCTASPTPTGSPSPTTSPTPTTSPGGTPTASPTTTPDPGCTAGTPTTAPEPTGSGTAAPGTAAPGTG